MIVFAGPSGVGKSTLAKHLLSHRNDFAFSISATTRPQREGDVPNQSYYFLSLEKFNTHIDHGDFIEYEEVYPDRFYGTLKSEVTRINDEGKNVIFDIDVLGALNIKKQFPNDSLIVLVQPDSLVSLEQRLRNRGSDTEEEIQTRIDRFEQELSYADKFDEIITNRTGDIEGAIMQIDNILNKYFPKRA